MEDYLTFLQVIRDTAMTVYIATWPIAVPFTIYLCAKLAAIGYGHGKLKKLLRETPKHDTQ
jgi:hypothetical protein